MSNDISKNTCIEIPENQLSEIKTIQNEELAKAIELAMPTDGSGQSEETNKTQGKDEEPKDDTICLHILDIKDADKGSPNAARKDYMVYEYFVGAQQQKFPTSVWVQQMGSDGGGGMDYDPDSRNSFLLLVFLIVTIMLAITAAFVICVFQIEALSEFFTQYGLILVLPAMCIMIGLSYGLACSACCRMFPCNIIILVISVVCMSIIAAYVTNRYRTEIVFYALLATAAILILCMALACTSYDFTSWTLYVMAISAVFGVIVMIYFISAAVAGTYMKVIHLIILIVGTILNVVGLIIELQMILGGRSIEISENDYALAAYMLYTSIVNIFLQLVQILGILDSM